MASEVRAFSILDGSIQEHLDAMRGTAALFL